MPGARQLLEVAYGSAVQLAPSTLQSSSMTRRGGGGSPSK